MSIRIRTVNGVRTALCAAENPEEPGDLYLDDADHHALAVKFMADWEGNGIIKPIPIRGQWAMKFRKKPVVVEAVQWKGEPSIGAVQRLTKKRVTWSPARKTLRIETMEGVMEASLGDWIIRGVTGECYPCKPDIFVATYEPEEE